MSAFQPNRTAPPQTEEPSRHFDATTSPSTGENEIAIDVDVMVMEPHTGSTAGHVAGYDGKHWVSDFVQRDFWAGKEYRKERPHYAVYRY